MPVEFLSQERRERLGRFNADPTAEQLARYFHLDDVDRALVDRRARDRARLGFALQLGTVRFLGTFLAEPTDVPRVVVEYVARQLGSADLSVLKGDGETRWDHAAEIRRAYGPFLAFRRRFTVQGGGASLSSPMLTLRACGRRPGPPRASPGGAASGLQAGAR